MCMEGALHDEKRCGWRNKRRMRAEVGLPRQRARARRGESKRARETSRSGQEVGAVTNIG
jgi:hypothetical protein